MEIILTLPHERVITEALQPRNERSPTHDTNLQQS